MAKDISRRKFIYNSSLGAFSLAVLPGFLLNNNNNKNIKLKGANSQMAYEWKFNTRPYSDEEAKTLLKDVVSPETSDWHYNTHHKGYVTFLNNIEKELETADRAKANGNYSQVGELKRRLTWNHGGTVLHDVYWEVLGGDGDSSKGKDIHDAIVKEFGSIEKWKEDFKATATAAKLSGWGVLVYDRLYSGRLLNVLVDEHHYGAIWAEFRLLHAMYSNMLTTTKTDPEE